MEAKDTVMKNKSMLDLEIPCETCGSKSAGDFPTRECMECIALRHRQAQAEISFKAGREEASKQLIPLHQKLEEIARKLADVESAIQEARLEGRREVVEWVNNYRNFLGGISIQSGFWKAQLKAWGLAEEE